MEDLLGCCNLKVGVQRGAVNWNGGMSVTLGVVVTLFLSVREDPFSKLSFEHPNFSYVPNVFWYSVPLC